MTGALVGLLVLAGAWALAGPSAGARLSRVLGAAPRRREGGRGRTRPWWRGGARSAGGTRGPDAAAQAAQLAVLLRAGLAPAVAWQHLADVAGAGPGGAWRAAAAAAAGGGSVAGALRDHLPGARAEGERAASALAAVTASVELCERTGAPAAQVLAGVAGTLRDDGDARDAREAALAAPRATARVLLGLPVAGLLLGQVVGAQPLVVLTTTVPGRLSAVVGVVLGVVGWWWSRALVRGAEHGGPRKRGCRRVRGTQTAGER